MSERKTLTALIPVQSAALVRRAREALTKRGLEDLVTREGAEVWFQRAMELYRAAPKNCPVAQFRASLGEFFQCIQRAANLNPQHPDIQYWLGTAYRDGLGTEVDLAAAAAWIQRAAEQGLAEAQVQLAGMLMYGEGVIEDAAGAVDLFRRAAAQNHVDAQLALGVAYADGTGVIRNLVESSCWFRKAAEQDSVSAQFFFAEALAQGRGVSKDPLEAAKWYRKAANQGMADAQFSLGKLYYRGLGVPEDLAEAEYWFGESAKHGMKEAEIMLEVCLAGIDQRTIHKIAAKRDQ